MPMRVAAVGFWDEARIARPESVVLRKYQTQSVQITEPMSAMSCGTLITTRADLEVPGGVAGATESTSALKNTSARFWRMSDTPSVSMIWFMVGSLRIGLMVRRKIPIPKKNRNGTVIRMVR